MAGLNYDFFCPRDTKRPPYYVNTRVYSCILLSNDVPYRWRGLFNEDTDLSLQVLKGGWCTMLTNQFLVGKAASMTMKGGNTGEVYKIETAGSKHVREIGKEGDNRKEFAEVLAAAHPDVVRVVWRDDLERWHHDVNYGEFIQKPIKISTKLLLDL